jgi:hypothetical protein
MDIVDNMYYYKGKDNLYMNHIAQMI